jgi:predicted Fe-Mo cluster-binding NifX family protein
MRIAVPCVESRGKYILVSHFGRAPSFAIVDVEGDKYNLVEIFRNEYITREHGRGVALVNELIARGVNALLTLEIGYGAYYKVRESGIKIYYITPEDKESYHTRRGDPDVHLGESRGGDWAEGSSLRLRQLIAFPMSVKNA